MHCNTCDGYSYSTNVYTFKLLVVGSMLVLLPLNITRVYAVPLFVYIAICDSR